MKIFKKLRLENNLLFKSNKTLGLFKANYFLFSIFIKTQNTPNPHFLKFLPGKEICKEGETFDFSNLKESKVSPLARRIFEVKK
jgi:hypothetical protein